MNDKITKKTILVCGTLAYDHIMDFPGKFSEHILEGKTHILNVTFAVNGVKESFGGTGGNIAYNLALLGVKPKLIAVAGRDFSKYKKWLKKNKIDITGVKVMKQGMMAKFYVITDQADNQIGGYYPGSKIIPPAPLYQGGINGKTSLYPALKQAGQAPFTRREKSALAIIAPDIVTRMVKYAKIFKQNNISYIFDPGQQITEYNARELKYGINGAKMLIGNDYEIQLILNKLGFNLADLRKLVEILVITKGAAGSEIYYGGGKIKIPAAKPKAVLDPTGAGDAYRAGLIKGLVLGLSLEKCGRLAATTAVYTVEKYGTQTHRFSWKEIQRRYEENYKEKL